DGRSDFYSLGATLFCMLTGRVPFEGSMAQVIDQHLNKPPPLDKIQHLPKCVIELVGKLLQKQPNQRPRDASILYQEITSCIENI
ncbi:MAG: protein kinase, partial [Chthoniobacterales bacterium]|nr:protein kinase [Chthoniobacterales bacterium]